MICSKGPAKDEQERNQLTGEDQLEEQAGGGFLVCIHDVSPDIPYAILKVSAQATAGEVLRQALFKGRSTADPDK